MRSVYQIVVYVPVTHADSYIAAVTPHIPQLFGNYDGVAWRSSDGVEQFRPLDGANPTEGKIGEMTELPSMRFEFCVSDDDVALQAMMNDVLKPKHPWEEPVILVSKVRVA